MYESWCLESAQWEGGMYMYESWCLESAHGKEARTCMRAGVWNQHMGKRHVHV